MSPLGPITDHLDLVRRMARATKTDLGAAMQDGTLTSDSWATMVTNCRGCAGPGACSARLSTLELADGVAPAPDYCRNRATFDRLGRQGA
ncbi:DUF6455 family protein [Pseudooceanicola onchidii]|uniref:DUF6455 family protein n=1 Tax=Pseudooceanicola onchidii TaxID=2562279 RepID=UPI0010AAF269|nr:DUF6455 family protein [Pseudooceanicola onchidii]